MKIAIGIMVLCTLGVMKQTFCLRYIDIPIPNLQPQRRAEDDETYRPRRNYPPIRDTSGSNRLRRNLLAQEHVPGADKDADIKVKISTLVEQTLHDTERRVKSIDHIKNKHRDEAPYKAGFILSMIKKARDVLNELFNVAVHHKDQWKALEQLKIFELIVHTNVDTTNLVRQLVEIHIQHLNTTSGGNSVGGEDAPPRRKRVVLL